MPATVPDTVSGFDVDALRSRFTQLRETGFAFFDSPGGSLVPDEVADVIAEATRVASANLGANYATSRRVGEITNRARQDAAAFLGGDPENIVFGPNMTTLNFALSRAATRDFAAGDEIVVTALDHDGNVAPWRELAADRGLVVKVCGVTADLRVDIEQLRTLVTDRTRVVAFPWASNAVGSVTDAREVSAIAHAAGAISWADAVHYAAHRVVDARAAGVDVVLCSPYKFCGPHLGIAHVEPSVADGWRAYKVQPRPPHPLGQRFETGTMPYELLAGFSATVRYLDSFGGLAKLASYEDALAGYLLKTLPTEVQVHGPALEHRVPTFLTTVDGVPAEAIARHFAERDIGVWNHDHWYAMGLPAYLPFQGESVRVGIAQYNTVAEVDRLAQAFSEVIAAR